MHKSARTAQIIRPSRSGSSTMQPATGQAAWQMEQAKAPKQRSGSMTAIVFGAFLRGPDIILVHMHQLYRELLERLTGGRLADLRHRRKERRSVLVDQRVGVRPEEAPVARLERIGDGLVPLTGFARSETVARAGRPGICGRLDL